MLNDMVSCILFAQSIIFLWLYQNKPAYPPQSSMYKVNKRAKTALWHSTFHLSKLNSTFNQTALLIVAIWQILFKVYWEVKTNLRDWQRNILWLILCNYKNLSTVWLCERRDKWLNRSLLSSEFIWQKPRLCVQ